MGVTLGGIAKAARDGFTTSIGLGVLVYQRAQVYRHQVVRTISHVVDDLNDRRHNPPNRE